MSELKYILFKLFHKDFYTIRYGNKIKYVILNKEV